MKKGATHALAAGRREHRGALSFYRDYSLVTNGAELEARRDRVSIKTGRTESLALKCGQRSRLLSGLASVITSKAAAGRCGRRQRHARPLTAPRACAQVRTWHRRMDSRRPLEIPKNL
jgi:hypothetical protein